MSDVPLSVISFPFVCFERVVLCSLMTRIFVCALIDYNLVNWLLLYTHTKILHLI